MNDLFSTHTLPASSRHVIPVRIWTERYVIRPTATRELSMMPPREAPTVLD